jgi:molybdenum cofactor cytidylyltransferase
MKFGEVAVGEASGAILAHSLRGDGFNFKKGRCLTADDVETLAAAGINAVVAARLEAGDIGEDQAAAKVAAAITGDNIAAGAAFTGRVNLVAETDGLVCFDRAALEAVNLIDEAVTVATVAPFERVRQKQILATIKIIPYGVAGDTIDACVAAAAHHHAMLELKPFAAKKVTLVQTTLPGLKDSILDKTHEITRDRVEGLGMTLAGESRIGHIEADVADAVKQAGADGADILLIAGASAVTDRRDVIPAGIVSAGGKVIHCGMPVDPGNLLVFGVCGGMQVIGLPGCARSPKFNGIDLVLQRLAANVPVGSAEIMAMGVGGLLKETASRPSPRAQESEELPSKPKIAALILAAGQSRRMGSANKLLAEVDGQPMVAHAAETVLASEADPVIAVTGHESERISEILAPYNLTIVHNPRYAEGISSSVQRGLAALPSDIDGALVCLGDMPRVTAAAIDKLIAAFNPVEQRAICVPTWRGKRGNPVLLAARFFPEINDIAGDVGARGLIGAYPELVCEVEMADDGILLDVDTPQALASLTGTDDV